MSALAGPSLGLFAVVFGLLCLASSAVVTDAWLKDCRPGPADDRIPPEA